MRVRKVVGGEDSPLICYSEAFKRSVVAEIERGELNKEQARRKYAIGGKATVLGWMRRYGRASKRDILMVHQQGEERLSPSAARRIRELEAENRKLRLEAENERLKALLYEKMIDLAEEKHQIQIRKNSGAKR